ncbi:MAG TPA: CHAT domain-containing protein, partial [Vicinamibacterales bacterium]
MTSYLNFDLELGDFAAGPDGRWTYYVRAAGTPRAQVQSIQAADRVEVPPGAMDKTVAVLARRWDVPEDEFGRACLALEQWLLPAASRARALLEASLTGLADDESLLLRLRCRDDPLARLPWEFAAFDVARLPDDGRFHADRMLAMHPRICVVRFEELTAPVERREQRAPRLLFATAAPPDMETLALHVERTRIEAALADAKPLPEATWVEHTTIAKLQRSLLDAPFDVFQFSGHGGSSRGGFLCLEREELSDGTFEAEKLGLALSGKGVRLAVLAACVTAQVELELPWSSVARALVAGGVPAVVGMQLNIDDRSALEFLATFYHALATCLPIGTAINEARKRIGLLRELDRDFGVPVLYLRNAQGWDGVLFPPVHPEGAVERGIRAADAYKRLHDALHKAKMDAFHLIMGYANDFPPKSGASQRPLRSYVNTIKRCVSEMRGIVAEGHCDRDLIDPFVDALDQATVQLESAVTHLD